ncbi:MAG: glycosyltransferase family 2 protein [Proteobacteria bacterium]|nr:glycosyltransferase family 2 protein [Pseudomonadota bacterium]
MPECTIIIPAYNEEEGIRSVINGLKSMQEKCEILVVDDGSTDSTFKFASESGVRVVHHPYNKGYGAALKTGIRNAKTDVVLLMDADGQHKPDDACKLLRYMNEYDMVVGSRTNNSHISLLRKPGKKILSIVANYLSGTKIPDLNSGFRAIKKSMAMDFMHILPNGFSFTTTITLAALTSGYSVKYVPIEAPKRVGTSKIRPFRDGFLFIMLIIRTVSLFNPMKVVLPVSGFFIFGGLIYALDGIIVSNHIPSGALLALISGTIIFFFGIIADQISVLIRRSRD